MSAGVLEGYLLKANRHLPCNPKETPKKVVSTEPTGVCTVCCRAENSTSGRGSSTCSVLDNGMQTIQESLQAEYDELYVHYQVSDAALLITSSTGSTHCI